MEKIVFLGMLLLLLIPGVFVYQTVGCLFPLHPDWKRRLILFFWMYSQRKYGDFFR